MKTSLSKDQALRKIQDSQVAKLTAAVANKTAGKFYEAVKTGNISDDAITAGLLNNFSKIMDAANTGAAGLTGAGNVDGNAINVQGDFGPYVMEVWPLVAAWYNDFPLKDLISVQDMDKPLAYLFFSKLKTGTSKADTVQGEYVETPLGMRVIKGKYPTGEVFGEIIPKGDLNEGKGLLAYAPLNVADIQGRNLSKHKVEIINDADGSVVDTFKGGVISGNAVQLTNGAEGADEKFVTIDIETGEFDVSGIATPIADGQSVKVNYVWNLDYATDENIQKVKEEVEMRPMEALPRAIALEWTVFSEYVKKSQFGQDIRTDNTKRILNLLYQYQVRYVIDDLYENADADAVMFPEGDCSIDLNIGSGITLEVSVANILVQLNKISNALEKVNGRMEGNRIVCGQNFKTWAESLPDNLFKKVNNNSTGFSGPRELGEIGRFKVYYDPFMSAREGFMTYRGSEWYDAVYYLGEYMPIVPTDAVTLGVTVRSAFCAMEAYRYDKAECVVKLDFHFGND